MKCDRCGRAMAYEQFIGEQERFWGWRCVFCGEIVDDVILESRPPYIELKGTVPVL